MGFFSRFFKRQPTVFPDTFKVVLTTDKKLSEEQKNVITQMVKDGTLSGCDPSDIAINIMLYTGCFEPVILHRIDNGVEAIF